MGVISSAARELIAAGVTGDALVMALERIEAGLVPGQSAGARRQAAYRQRNKASQVTVSDVTPTTITSDGSDVTGDAPLARGETNLITLSPSSIEESKKEVEVARSAPGTKGTRLPPDWAPKDQDWQWAVDRLGEEAAAEQTAAFKDHWPEQPGQKGVKVKWDGTYRNWIRNARKPSQRAGPEKRQTAKSQFLDVARDMIESQLNEPTHSAPELQSIGGPRRGFEVGSGHKIIALVPNGGGRPVHHEGQARSIPDFGERLPFVIGERGV